MLQKGGLLAFAAFAAFAAIAGCNESFECAADRHCKLDGVAGFCESIGHCSFPDDACDTGRRFGSLAGTLSDQCVPPADGTSTTTLPGSSSDSSVTATVSSSTGDTGSGSGSTGAGSVGTTTGGAALPCTILYEDSFPGDTIDPTWQVLGDPTVSGGAARFAIDPKEVGIYDKLVALGGSALDLSEGVVTLEVESTPQTSRTQGTLTLVSSGAPILLLWESGGLHPLAADRSVEHSGMNLQWVRVALTAGADGTSSVVFSESENGTEWTDFATVENLDFDSSSTRVELTAGSYAEFATPQQFVVRSISICGNASGI